MKKENKQKGQKAPDIDQGAEEMEEEKDFQEDKEVNVEDEAPKVCKKPAAKKPAKRTKELV